jgi:ubiquinone/menaquinone biosynthesis C-methylase UbiE
MPLKADQFDVVLSNCVLNLVPDKHKAFSEIHRVLKPGGHFCVSDVVVKGTLPEKLRKDAEMYAGCVSGALELEKYLDVIHKAGFRDMQIHKQKRIEIPQETLEKYIPKEQIEDFNTGDKGIFSITISAKR